MWFREKKEIKELKEWFEQKDEEMKDLTYRYELLNSLLKQLQVNVQLSSRKK